MNTQQPDAYELGFPTFKKLFDMEKKQLLILLREICAHRVTSDDLLADNSLVTKTIVNDIPNEIVVSSYDTLIITPYRIEYRGSEPGEFQIIVEFNRFFTL